MADRQIITPYRRKLLAQATSGATDRIPKIAQIALGDGGCDENGEPIDPVVTQTELTHELARYPISEVQYPDEFTARYRIVLPKADLAGQSFSEIALVDEDGSVCGIKTMYPKKKDDDIEFTFYLDDEF